MWKVRPVLLYEGGHPHPGLVLRTAHLTPALAGSAALPPGGDPQSSGPFREVDISRQRCGFQGRSLPTNVDFTGRGMPLRYQTKQFGGRGAVRDPTRQSGSAGAHFSGCFQLQRTRISSNPPALASPGPQEQPPTVLDRLTRTEVGGGYCCRPRGEVAAAGCRRTGTAE